LYIVVVGEGGHTSRYCLRRCSHGHKQGMLQLLMPFGIFPVS